MNNVFKRLGRLPHLCAILWLILAVSWLLNLYFDFANLAEQGYVFLSLATRVALLQKLVGLAGFWVLTFYALLLIGRQQFFPQVSLRKLLASLLLCFFSFNFFASCLIRQGYRIGVEGLLASCVHQMFCCLFSQSISLYFFASLFVCAIALLLDWKMYSRAFVKLSKHLLWISSKWCMTVSRKFWQKSVRSGLAMMRSVSGMLASRLPTNAGQNESESDAGLGLVKSPLRKVKCNFTGRTDDFDGSDNFFEATGNRRSFGEAGLAKPKGGDASSTEGNFATNRVNYTSLPPDGKQFGQFVQKTAFFDQPEPIEELANALQEKLSCFGILGKIVQMESGPVLHQFEYEPNIDVKISKILALEHDLSLALRAPGVRILAPVPGKNRVGFEIARKKPQMIHFFNLLNGSKWTEFKATPSRHGLPLLLGVDSLGNDFILDLASCPHLLIAGTTGSGKSVCVHTLLASLLLSHSPDSLRLILIDPKRLEFSFYQDIPHLIFPVVTQMEKAGQVLEWLIMEMERRYELLAQVGKRDIADFNSSRKDKLAHIVLMIDELADLMMVGGKVIEMSLIRLAQMARASGIHLVVATQRPSVDVVTGLIKVNFPTRIAFRVSSKIDSRTILDASGAEKLLGKGDMLLLHPSQPGLIRLNGGFISTPQIEYVANLLRKSGNPNYVILRPPKEVEAELVEDEFVQDPLFDEVLEFVKTRQEVSISMLQRRFNIGFNRSARLIEELEVQEVISSAQGSKPRKVL